MKWSRAAAALASLALLGAAVGPSSGADLRAVVAPYLASVERGAVGQVEGTAFAEPRSPTGAPVPWEGMSVMLVPRSPEVEAELDAIKDIRRDSVTGYVNAYHRLAAARVEYERALAAAGGGTLVRGEVSDAAGRFRFTAVPAGAWLLVAWREVPHMTPGRKTKAGQARDFRDNWERAGHTVVEYWRQDVDVRTGETVSLSLFDRNEWMTVVREELRLPTDAAKPGSTKARRQGTTR
jgi:hypothetical protein